MKRALLANAMVSSLNLVSPHSRSSTALWNRVWGWQSAIGTQQQQQQHPNEPANYAGGIRTLAAGDTWPPWPESKDREVFEAVIPPIHWPNADFDVDAYAELAEHLRAAVRELGVTPVYVLESPRYFVEHLLPLFMAVPGWLLLLDTTACSSVVHGCKSTGQSEANARVASARFGVPKSAMLRIDANNFGLLFSAEHSSKLLLLSCTEPWLPKGHLQRDALIEQWRAYPLAITMAHGVDEDAVYCDRKRLDPAQRPEQWRDLRSTLMLRALMVRGAGLFGLPAGYTVLIDRIRVALGLSQPQSQEMATRDGEGSGVPPPPPWARQEKQKQTVLYISSVGEYEFLDSHGPSGLRQRVWQALRTLQLQGMDVVVSLHPLLEAGQIHVHMNILSLEAEAELGRCLVYDSTEDCERVSARGVSLDEARRRQEQQAAQQQPPPLRMKKYKGRRWRRKRQQHQQDNETITTCSDDAVSPPTSAQTGRRGSPAKGTASAYHHWAGRKIELIEALQEHRMLASWRPSANTGTHSAASASPAPSQTGPGSNRDNEDERQEDHQQQQEQEEGEGEERGRSILGFLDEVGGLSLLPLLADVVIAPVASGSAMTVLRAPQTPLILLRPTATWYGIDMSAVASVNRGLVLGDGEALVLDQQMGAEDLVAAVESELEQRNQTRVEGRRRYREYWHQTIDGFEELRTWFDLLGTVTEIIRGSSSDGGMPDALQEMYASLVASNALQD